MAFCDTCGGIGYVNGYELFGIKRIACHCGQWDKEEEIIKNDLIKEMEYDREDKDAFARNRF